MEGPADRDQPSPSPSPYPHPDPDPDPNPNPNPQPHANPNLHPNSWKDQLIATITDNIQINVSKVHVRLEDDFVDGFPFCVGLTLGSLAVRTCDREWQPLQKNVTRKLKPVDTAAALASGSTTRPHLPQPRARAFSRIVASGPSPFEATGQPSEGRGRLRICAPTRSQVTRRGR